MRTAGPRETSARIPEMLVDVRTCGLTLGQTMRIMDAYNSRPNSACWLDGDTYAIWGISE